MRQSMRFLALFAWMLLFFEPVLLAKRGGYSSRSSYSSSSRSYSSSSSSRSYKSPSRSSSFSWNKSSSPKAKTTTTKKTPTTSSSSSFFSKKTTTTTTSRGGYSSSSTKKATPAPKKVTSSSVKTNSPSKTTTTKTSSPKASTASTSNKSSNVKKAVAPKVNTKSSLNTAYKKEKAKSSLDKFRQNQSKFKTPAKTTSSTDMKKQYANNDLYQKAQSSKDYGRNYDDYSHRRRSFYDDRSWDPPVYVYNSAPSFGMFDAMFMWMMLDSINDAKYASMAHNYRHDPSFQEWRREADRLSRDNAELKAKLNNMDAKLNNMQGQPIQKGYVPEGVDPGMMLAPTMMVNHEAESRSFRIATASTSGLYHKYGHLLQEYHKGDYHLEIVETSGSQQNMELLRAGVVHAAVAQSDVIGKDTILHKTALSHRAPLWREYVHFIVNSESGIDSIGDLGKKHTLYIGEIGSGTSETWSGFIATDSGYASIPTTNSNYDTALKAVLRDKNAVMLYVSGLQSPFMNDIEVKHGKQLSLVAVDDWNFNNAYDADDNKVYEFDDIKSDTYKNLQLVEGFIFDSAEDVETLYLDAELIVSPQGKQKLGTNFNAFMQTAIDAKVNLFTAKAGALQ